MIQGQLCSNFILFVLDNSANVRSLSQDFINADIILMDLHFETVGLVPQLGNICSGDIGFYSKHIFLIFTCVRSIVVGLRLGAMSIWIITL